LVFFTHDSLFGRAIAATVIKITLLFCLIFNAAHGSDDLEYKIKAAYLYNFTKFISWPEKDSETFNLCIVGSDPFDGLLASLESKTALNKPIRVHRYEHAKQASGCHILYFDKEQLPAEIANALPAGTLTVGSHAFFAETGGMIGFVLEEEKIRLHINLKALKRSGLGISAKLIEVSTLAEGDEHE